MSEVVVVGGGIGGLAVAARLGRLGHRVTLPERRADVGGRVVTVAEAGYRFDLGPAALTLPAALRDLFRKTGKPLETVLDLTPTAVPTRHELAGGTVLDPVELADDPDRQRLLAAMAQVWDATRGPLVEAPVQTRAELRRLMLRQPDLARALLSGRTLRDLTRAHLRDGRQRQVVEHPVLARGADPRDTPVPAALDAFVEATFGSWSVPGGSDRLVEVVRARAELRGVTILTGVEVVEVVTDSRDGGDGGDGRVGGVVTADGSRVPADVVVDATPGGVAVAAERTGPLTASAFLLLLGLRARPGSDGGGSDDGDDDGIGVTTVLHPAPGDGELDAVFGPHARPAEEPTMTVRTGRAAGMAPAGHEAMTVQVTAARHAVAGAASGPGRLDWSRPGVASSYAAVLLDVMAARGHDVRDRLVVAEHRSPADLERDLGVPGGAVYGHADTGRRAILRRAPNVSGRDGVFRVGDTTRPGSGIAMVLMSAAFVAETIGRA